MSYSALYLHIPFCIRRCRYCDFATDATPHGDPLVAAYVAALESLVSRLSAAGLLRSVRTGYIGGGTPTMAGEGLARLVAQVRRACPGIVELSTEANPESLTDTLARSLAASGTTRVSLGVQSLDDAELAQLGRAHSSANARAAARFAVDAGLDLSCDLMCGIPLQTPQSWEESLYGVLGLGVCHVSCYPLMLEEGTPLEAAVSRGEVSVADDDAAADRMVAAERILGQAGFSRYEVASYARPGKRCAHNVAYWTGASYLGLGTSAASMMAPGEFAALAEALPLSCTPEPCETERDGGPLDSPDGLLDSPETSLGGPGIPVDGTELAARMLDLGERAVARVRMRLTDDARTLAAFAASGKPLAARIETLTAREAAAEDLMLGMRMTDGVPRAAFGDAVGAGIPRNELERACADLEVRGLARRTDGGGFAPTERGWLLGNELYGMMWDLAGGK